MAEEHKIRPLHQVCRVCGFESEHASLSQANFCPRCGQPTEVWHDIMCTYLSRAKSPSAMSRALKQFYKREYQAAARTALIVIEDDLRRRTQTDLVGSDLVAKAFGYQRTANGEIEQFPFVRVNDLVSEADRNEHEGIKLLFLGTIRGIRNIVAHHDSDFPVATCFRILSLCDLLLDISENGSINSERVCLWRRNPDDPNTLVSPH